MLNTITFILLNDSLKYYILIFFISAQVKLGPAGFRPLYHWAFISENLNLHLFYAFFPKNTVYISTFVC